MTIEIPVFSNAACKTVGGELFFPDERGEYHELEGIRAVCNGCPEREACLDWAVRHETDGIWAGTTPNQRIQMRRKLGIQVSRIEPRSVAYNY